MTTAELIKRAVAELEAVGIEHDDAVSDTRFLLCDALDIEYKDLLLMQGKEADEADKLRFEEYIKKRRQRIPCQYITGKAYFMGRVFTVAEGVLVFFFHVNSIIPKKLDKIKQPIVFLNIYY